MINSPFPIYSYTTSAMPFLNSSSSQNVNPQRQASKQNSKSDSEDSFKIPRLKIFEEISQNLKSNPHTPFMDKNLLGKNRLTDHSFHQNTNFKISNPFPYDCNFTLEKSIQGFGPSLFDQRKAFEPLYPTQYLNSLYSHVEIQKSEENSFDMSGIAFKEDLFNSPLTTSSQYSPDQTKKPFQPANFIQPRINLMGSPKMTTPSTPRPSGIGSPQSVQSMNSRKSSDSITSESSTHSMPSYKNFGCYDDYSIPPVSNFNPSFNISKNVPKPPAAWIDDYSGEKVQSQKNGRTEAFHARKISLEEQEGIPANLIKSVTRHLLVCNMDTSINFQYLQALFGQYGDIRSLNIQFLNHGKLIISYFDLRSAYKAYKNLNGVYIFESSSPLVIRFLPDLSNSAPESTDVLALIVNGNYSFDSVYKAFSKFGDIVGVSCSGVNIYLRYYDLRNARKAYRELERSQKAAPQEIENKLNEIEFNPYSIQIQNMMEDLQKENINLLNLQPKSAFHSDILQKPQQTPSETQCEQGFAQKPIQKKVSVQRVPNNSPKSTEKRAPLKEIKIQDKENINAYQILNANATSFSPTVDEYDFKIQNVGLYKGIKRRNTSEREKARYRINLEQVKQNKDTRTTVMIKNIPNKYTQRLLLETIEAAMNQYSSRRKHFDFLYLPIDFKNKCNVGYAFINFTSLDSLVLFFNLFNGKKWMRFNSEKICALTYARVQGKMALINHFQTSSIMNQMDERVKPLIL